MRRLFLVNAHVTNAAPLRCALEMLRAAHDDLMVALIDIPATLSARVRAAHFADAGDWHANEAETALMQALAPELVRPERIAEADDPDRTDGLGLRASRQPHQPQRRHRPAAPGARRRPARSSSAGWSRT